MARAPPDEVWVKVRALILCVLGCAACGPGVDPLKGLEDVASVDAAAHRWPDAQRRQVCDDGVEFKAGDVTLGFIGDKLAHIETKIDVALPGDALGTFIDKAKKHTKGSMVMARPGKGVAIGGANVESASADNVRAGGHDLAFITPIDGFFLTYHFEQFDDGFHLTRFEKNARGLGQSFAACGLQGILQGRP